MIYKHPRKQPEAAAALRLTRLMRFKGWGVWKHGAGKYVAGWPDYYSVHPEYGHRWFETKVPTGKLRPSQVTRFTEMAKYGESIWVLRDERDYMLLFGLANWRLWLP